MTIVNPHVDPLALDALNAFLSRVRDRSVRKRLEAIYALHPKRWGALMPDVFWMLDWDNEWTSWPQGAEQKLSRHLDGQAWLFSCWEGICASRRLADILESETGSLVIVPGVCDLVCNFDDGMAINWMSPSKP